MFRRVLTGFLAASLLMGATSAFASPGNENFSSAESINVNQTYNGVLNDYYDKDFYSFTLAKAGNIQLIVPNKSGVQWEAVIYDSEGKLLDTLYTDGGELATGNSIVRVGLPAGKYYINFENHSSTTDKPYSFKVLYEQSDFFERESDDTLSTAKSIVLNKVYKGNIADYYDKDFYSFTLAKAGNIQLIVPNKSGAQWKAVIYDSEGKALDTLYTDGGELATGNSIVPAGLPAGKYYINFENYSSTTDKPYSFQVAFIRGNHFEKERNDTLSSANPIELNYKYTGSVSDYYDKDFYKFTLNKTSTVKISIANQEEKVWRAILYDGKGNQIDTLYTSKEFGTKNLSTQLQTKLSSGTYYIHLENYSSSTDSPYYFSITTKQFPDVAINHWAHNEITFLSNKGIISGFKDGSFKPNNSVTKAQAAMMITRVLKLNTSNVKNPGFKDVSTNHSAYGSIAAVTNAGIFPKGTNFNPNAALTRQEMAMALVEAYDLKGTYNGKVTDVSDSKTLNYVKILAANKVTYLNADGTFKPKGTVTRAQFSAFFARILDEQFKN